VRLRRSSENECEPRGVADPSVRRNPSRLARRSIAVLQRSQRTFLWSEPCRVDRLAWSTAIVWLQGMSGGFKSLYECVKAFSRPISRKTSRSSTCRRSFCTALTTRSYRSMPPAVLSASSSRRGTQGVFGAPHGMCSTLKDRVTAIFSRLSLRTVARRKDEGKMSSKQLDLESSPSGVRKARSTRRRSSSRQKRAVRIPALRKDRRTAARVSAALYRDARQLGSCGC